MPLRKLQEIIVDYARHLYAEGRFRALESSEEYPYDGPAFDLRLDGSSLELVDNTQERFTLPDGEEIMAPADHRGFREPRTNQVWAAFLKFRYWENKILGIREESHSPYTDTLRRELEIVTRKLLPFAIGILRPAAESYALPRIDPESGQDRWNYAPCDLTCRHGMLESGENVPAEIQVKVEELNDLIRETEKHIRDIREYESRAAASGSRKDTMEAIRLLREMIADYAGGIHARRREPNPKASPAFGDLAMARPKREDDGTDAISYRKRILKKAVNQSPGIDYANRERTGGSTGRRARQAGHTETPGAASAHSKATPKPDCGTKRTKPRRSKTSGNLLTAAQRRKAVDAYIDEVFDKTGKRITRTDIWKSARYKNRTDFQRWQRNDPKTSRTAKERFPRLLKEKPHLK
jgi:hypothetical protein